MFVLGFFKACGDPQPQILDQSRALNVKSSNVNMKVISNWNFCFLWMLMFPEKTLPEH